MCVIAIILLNEKQKIHQPAVEPSPLSSITRLGEKEPDSVGLYQLISELDEFFKAWRCVIS